MKPLLSILRNTLLPSQNAVPAPGLLTDPKAKQSGLQRPILRRAPGQMVPDIQDAPLQIHCPDPTVEDKLRDKHMYAGQHLSRQERWGELADKIRIADQARAMTPGSMPVADLMAYGARADVVLAVEHALLDGRPEPDAPLLAGIEELEHVLADHDENYVVASIIGQAHMDIAWAWRGTGWDVEIPDLNRSAFEAHFDRAASILKPFSAADLKSPLLAASCCALLGGTQSKRRDVADRYETLIDLNPANPRAMRAMGNHLLPRWYGSYDALELEARRTAARSQNTWGAGAYTWVMFDAICYDDQACANLDLTFFVEGLRDILKRNADPYTVNLLAAYCANAIGQAFSGNDQADNNRSQIAECAHWIVRDYLTELHPMIWAHAAMGFDNNLRVHSPRRFAASGREDAMRIIISLFQREIASGQKIIFTEAGPEVMSA